MMEAIWTSGTVLLYRNTIQRHTPEELDLNLDCCESLKISDITDFEIK
jgi:hypothetical protein